jgi:hypothetical protein
MATLRFLLKRFVAQRSLGLAVVVTLAFTIGVLVAGPIYADSAREAILTSSLGGEGVTVANARVQVFGAAGFDWAAADEAVTTAFDAVPVDDLVPQGLGTVRLGSVDGPSVPFVFRDGADRHLAIAGEAPGPGEIALPAGTAAGLGLRPGDPLDVVGPADDVVTLRLSGTFDSPDRDDPFWYGNRSPFPAPDEARSSGDEEYGEERLAQLAANTPGGNPDCLVDTLLAAVVAWTNGPAQDDATLIVVERAR